MTDDDTLRTRIAWLMWCANEGYLTDADRALVSNIFTADPTTLHPDDAFSLPRWLEMADAVIRDLAILYVSKAAMMTEIQSYATDHENLGLAESAQDLIDTAAEWDQWK